MDSQPWHIETRLLAPAPSGHPFGATAAPVFQSAAFAYESAEEIEGVFAGREPGYVYSRIGNPTLTAFERRMADLEDGVGALCCASGMAAASATLLTLAGTGDEIVSANSIFGGTYSLLDRTLARYGIVTRFVPSTDIDAYRAAVTDRTRAIFVETIGNPKLDVPDLEAIGSIARETGVAFVVDSTATSPMLIRPGGAGADVVIHSTTKYINGHGTAIGGVIVDCGSFPWRGAARYEHLGDSARRFGQMAFLAALRNWVWRDLGCCLSPFNAFLMGVGLETLAVRMERLCSTALTVARFLHGHPAVECVRYPGLPHHTDYGVARRQFGGRFGGLLTLRLGSKERCFRFINALQLARNLANLGDARTLVIHPASTICRDATEEQREAMGVCEDLVRLSIGLEHPNDITADLDRALGAAGELGEQS